MMDTGNFITDEGFNVPTMLQPYRPQPEEFPTYNATVHSNVFSTSAIDQEGLDTEFEYPPEEQPTASWSENVATYVATTYGEAPAWSSITALVRVSHNNSTNNVAFTTASSSGSRNHPKTNCATPSSKGSGNKRKLEDYVGCFSILIHPEDNKRKRRAFGPEERKDVAIKRKVKACSRCKGRKVKVSVSLHNMRCHHI